MQGDKLVQVIPIEHMSPREPSRIDTLRADLEAMAVRVTVLEGR